MMKEIWWCILRLGIIGVKADRGGTVCGVVLVEEREWFGVDDGSPCW
jgi:hypothetical protein